MSITAEQLRRVLPPIIAVVRHEQIPQAAEFLESLTGHVAIDCEWAPYEPLIGVGNEQGVVQFFIDRLPPKLLPFIEALLDNLACRCPVVMHNAKADLGFLKSRGFNVTWHQGLEDTMLAHAVLEAEDEHTLERLCVRYGKLPNHKHLAETDLSVYNAGDVYETAAIWPEFVRQFSLDPAAEWVYRDQSLRLIPEQMEFEEHGIRLAQAKLPPLIERFEAQRQAAQRLAEATSGWPLNLASPQQLQHGLYTVAGLPPQYAKEIPGQEPKLTADADALAALRRAAGIEWDSDEIPTLAGALAKIEAGSDPLVEARWLFAGAQQALSHYLTPMLDAKGQPRERIYPEWKIHTQASGRHSYTGIRGQKASDARVGVPIQQLKGELDTLIIPDEGTLWIGWDWSNVETWLLGGLAGDELILAAKEAEWDTHTLNLCDLLGQPYPPKLTKAIHTCPCAECAAWRESMRWQGSDDPRRTFAKTAIFRTHYKGNPAHMGDIPGARVLGFDGERMVEAIGNYLDKHHWIPEWWARMEEQIDRYRVVYTFMGRPRRLTSDSKWARYREGCNHPLQGGVADLYNTTLLLIRDAAPWLRLAHGRHDAQWWVCPEGREEEAWAIVKPIVTRTLDVHGRPMAFPASWKRKEAA
jgi:DNA polymerase I-like protein with 3'-5' exonuclease and polymerase domains